MSRQPIFPINLIYVFQRFPLTSNITPQHNRMKYMTLDLRMQKKILRLLFTQFRGENGNFKTSKTFQPYLNARGCGFPLLTYKIFDKIPTRSKRRESDTRDRKSKISSSFFLFHVNHKPDAPAASDTWKFSLRGHSRPMAHNTCILTRFPGGLCVQNRSTALSLCS